MKFSGYTENPVFMKSEGTAARHVRQFFCVYEGGRSSGLPRYTGHLNTPVCP